MLYILVLEDRSEQPSGTIEEDREDPSQWQLRGRQWQYLGWTRGSKVFDGTVLAVD